MILDGYAEWQGRNETGEVPLRLLKPRCKIQRMAKRLKDQGFTAPASSTAARKLVELAQAAIAKLEEVVNHPKLSSEEQRDRALFYFDELCQAMLDPAFPEPPMSLIPVQVLAARKERKAQPGPASCDEPKPAELLRDLEIGIHALPITAQNGTPISIVGNVHPQGGAWRTRRFSFRSLVTGGMWDETFTGMEPLEEIRDCVQRLKKALEAVTTKVRHNSDWTVVTIGDKTFKPRRHAAQVLSELSAAKERKQPLVSFDELRDEIQFSSNRLRADVFKDDKELYDLLVVQTGSKPSRFQLNPHFSFSLFSKVATVA